MFLQLQYANEYVRLVWRLAETAHDYMRRLDTKAHDAFALLVVTHAVSGRRRAGVRSFW